MDAVCSQAKRQIGLLHHHFHSVGSKFLIQLYKSLVLPTLDYTALFCGTLTLQSIPKSGKLYPTASLLRDWSPRTGVTVMTPPLLSGLLSLDEKEKAEGIALC